ncbi:3-oxoacyl-[acyl-carrier-protein] reductase [Desulfonauticus submarinus]|uniref:3-oxoacyl-[acyl-carrier-protein] reductase n=1 Tax=Desulfonauticus submarinus TaxID=206665 RepID=A0A1H0FG53_9BACT|nr:3-oxoacyl-[acyl-carrier-protein] reductase [Desulfonauticus submarinus]SDN93399.1 3-oxoacyl-[acyl-carrier-protein] reductase [Desulfonauticus submarinus]
MTKTAIITGASRGIGKSIALKLAEQGFQIFFTYVSKPNLAQEVVEEIKQKGVEAKAFCLDSSNWEEVTNFFKEQVKGKVKLEVLVNNAGITKDALIVRLKKEQWEDVLRVNLTGAFIFLQQAAKIMMKERYGRIINITSVVGQCGNIGQANYAAAKAGLIGLTKTAALELAPRNITVNAIAPGFITTDMTEKLPEEIKKSYQEKIPLHRFGSSEDIAELVAFLASKKAGYITGQIIGVNGGMYL